MRCIDGSRRGTAAACGPDPPGSAGIAVLRNAAGGDRDIPVGPDAVDGIGKSRRRSLTRAFGVEFVEFLATLALCTGSGPAHP
jgi:hypothetical protein